MRAAVAAANTAILAEGVKHSEQQEELLQIPQGTSTLSLPAEITTGFGFPNSLWSGAGLAYGKLDNELPGMYEMAGPLVNSMWLPVTDLVDQKFSSQHIEILELAI